MNKFELLTNNLLANLRALSLRLRLLALLRLRLMVGSEVLEE